MTLAYDKGGVLGPPGGGGEGAWWKGVWPVPFKCGALDLDGGEWHQAGVERRRGEREAWEAGERDRVEREEAERGRVERGRKEAERRRARGCPACEICN